MLHDCRTNTNWTGQGKTRQDSTKSINNINTAWQLEHAKYHRFLDFFKALMSKTLTHTHVNTIFQFMLHFIYMNAFGIQL